MRRRGSEELVRWALDSAFYRYTRSQLLWCSSSVSIEHQQLKHSLTSLCLSFSLPTHCSSLLIIISLLLPLLLLIHVGETPFYCLHTARHPQKTFIALLLHLLQMNCKSASLCVKIRKRASENHSSNQWTHWNTSPSSPLPSSLPLLLLALLLTSILIHASHPFVSDQRESTWSLFSLLVVSFILCLTRVSLEQSHMFHLWSLPSIESSSSSQNECLQRS